MSLKTHRVLDVHTGDAVLHESGDESGHAGTVEDQREVRRLGAHLNRVATVGGDDVVG